jgi:hypothetical protein
MPDALFHFSGVDMFSRNLMLVVVSLMAEWMRACVRAGAAVEQDVVCFI